MLLLVETVEDANAIDKKRATESGERAKSLLNDASNDLERAQAALNRAKTRLKVAEKI